MDTNDKNIDWQQTFDQLVGFVKQKVPSADDARDIVSDVMEKLLRELNNGNAPDNISAWLYTVTRNSIADFYRTRKPGEEIPEHLAEQTPEQNVLAELAHCVAPLIGNLPEQYREAILLSEIDGLNQKDVAERLGLSLSATKSRIMRGREKLLQNLQRCCTLHRDAGNRVMDFVQNKGENCNNCED